MIEGFVLAAIGVLLDPGTWLLLARLLEREDTKNADLRKWELTGL